MTMIILLGLDHLNNLIMHGEGRYLLPANEWPISHIHNMLSVALLLFIWSFCLCHLSSFIKPAESATEMFLLLRILRRHRSQTIGTAWLHGMGENFGMG